MLTDALTKYIQLKRAVGYQFVSAAYKLKSFVAYAEARDDTHIRTATVLDWSVLASSPEQRYKRLLAVRRFALTVHAEDRRHEVPAAGALARKRYERHPPYIFTDDEITRLLQAAKKLEPQGSIRPAMCATLFGLLAATGLRVSEALNLCFQDITEDGLIIRHTKFKKSRIVPIHDTTRQALAAYISAWRRCQGPDDSLFVNTIGRRPDYSSVKKTFQQLIRVIGIQENYEHRRPTIHGLRHSFAVRSLEQCGHDRDAVDRHIATLSTYLGHKGVSTTYWYLEATPVLMRRVAETCEARHTGGAT